MKAFKTFIAIAIASVMVLSMATSAFAAVTVGTVSSESVVAASGASNVAGQRTVLVVTKTSWSGSALVANPEILYINQVDNADLETVLGAMAGKNLIHGDYVVLVGSDEGTVDSGNFTAIKVVANEAGESVEGVTPISWEVTMNNALLTESGVVAQFYDKESNDTVGDPTTIWWEEDVASEFTGSGEFTFTAETKVSDQYAGTTGLAITAGTVSGKN